MRRVRIESTPPGDAPERVRRAWIGLTLPLSLKAEAQPGIYATQSVLAAKHGFVAGILRRFNPVLEEQPLPHYIIEASVAIAILQSAEPEAASWWEKHAPHVLEPGKLFAFAAHCCRELPDGPVQ
jgi:hypothetical protein